MLSEHWRHLLCQRLHLIICLCRKQIEEYRCRSLKQVIVMVSIVVNTYYRIVERRFRFIRAYSLYLLIVTPYTLKHSLLKIGNADFTKRCSVVRRAIRHHQRVLLVCHILISCFCRHMQHAAYVRTHYCTKIQKNNDTTSLYTLHLTQVKPATCLPFMHRSCCIEMQRRGRGREEIINPQKDI